MALIEINELGNAFSLVVDGGLVVEPAQNLPPRQLPVIATDAAGNQYSVIINSADGSLITTLVTTPVLSGAAPAPTALKLISSALRLIGVLASGEQLDIASANDALDVLNQMLDSWNAERQVIFTTRADDYALNIGQQVYALGPGGDFNTSRPSRIDGMSVILLSNPANPIEVPISMYSVEEWQTKIPVKAVNGSFPLVCYDDGGFPLRNLSMWPIPTQANNLRIYSWQGLGFPSGLQTALSFPPGYAEAFRYNLAVRLGPEFEQPVPPTVAELAAQSLARIKTMNAPSLELRSDLLPAPAGYNYKADLFGLGW